MQMHSWKMSFTKKIIYSEICKYFITKKQDIYNVLLICYYFFAHKIDKILNFTPPFYNNFKYL